MFQEGLKKKYEEIVVDDLSWVECRKCGFKWKSFMLEWLKDSSCPRCENTHTWFGSKVEAKKE